MLSIWVRESRILAHNISLCKSLEQPDRPECAKRSIIQMYDSCQCGCAGPGKDEIKPLFLEFNQRRTLLMLSCHYCDLSSLISPSAPYRYVPSHESEFPRDESEVHCPGGKT